MAKELTVTVALSLSKGNLKETAAPGNISVDVSGSKFERKIVNVGTAEEEIDLGDIVTPGFVLLRNLDGTNYVQAGGVTDAYSVRCKPGEPALFRLDSGSLFLKASGAPCDVDILVIAD